MRIVLAAVFELGRGGGLRLKYQQSGASWAIVL